MFSIISFVLILFFGQLLSLDNRSEKQVRKRFTVSPLAKKIISLSVGVVVAGISQKGAFLKKISSESGASSNLDGFLVDDIGSLLLACCFANLKLMPYFLAGRNLISFESGERLCFCVSALHGLCAGAICHYGLKKFFPNEKSAL